jgi:hypothetical protein
MLASSAHLTRTSHHNNPVDNFSVAQGVYFSHPRLNPTNGNYDQIMDNAEEKPQISQVS